MVRRKIAKTVEIPVNQLIKAHKLIDEINKEIRKDYKERYYMNLNAKLIGKLKELKDCVTVTD